MPRAFLKLFHIIIIGFIHFPFVQRRVLHLGLNRSGPHDKAANCRPVLCIVGNILSNDIHGSVDRIIHRRHLQSFLIRKVSFRDFRERPIRIFSINQLCQRLQPLLPGHHGPRPPLRAVRPVQILHSNLSLRTLDCQP